MKRIFGFFTSRSFAAKIGVGCALVAVFCVPIGGLRAEELIVDGGFEAGSLAHWNLNQVGAVRNTLVNDGTINPLGPALTLAPCRGSQSILMEQQGVNRQTFSRDIEVPFRVHQARLSWVDQIQSQGVVAAGDQAFRVEIRDRSNTLVEVLFETELPAGGLANSCGTRAFDLFRFRGQPLRLVFETISQSGLLSVQIDDVSLDITHSAATQPVISAIPDQVVFGRTVLGFGAPVVGPLAFTVQDLHGNIGPVSVTATSDNPSMIEDQDLLVTGNGAEWFVSVTDIGQVGSTADITIRAIDGNGKSASTTFTITSFSGAAVIVDNRSPGFSTTGAWQESAAIDEFSDSSLVSQVTGNSTATFVPELPVEGNYQVLAWWANTLADGRQSARGAEVLYTIDHSSGSDIVRLDQNQSSGQWVELGTFHFARQDGEGVTVAGRPDGSFQILNVDAIAFVATGAAAFAGDVIVDDLDPGFAASEGWSESGVLQEFRGQSLFSYSPQASASWTPVLPEAGQYEVFLWASRQAREGVLVSRASSVVYEILHGGQTTRVVVDQNAISSGTWTLLGSFRFDGSGDESIVLLPGSAGYGFGSVAADAIRFSPQNLKTALDVVVDNLDPGFEVEGSWRESGALDEFDGSSLYSTTLGDLATWNFPAVVPGVYQVYVWYSRALPNGRSVRRNTSARYFVDHDGRRSLVELNQNRGAGEWVSLGEFPFSASGGEAVSLQASSLSTSVDAVRFIRVQ